jgi:hypothetical protein
VQGGPWAPYSKKLIKDIFNILCQNFKTTQTLSMIGIFVALNNLCQAPPLGQNKKYLQSIITSFIS